MVREVPVWVMGMGDKMDNRMGARGRGTPSGGMGAGGGSNAYNCVKRKFLLRSTYEYKFVWEDTFAEKPAYNENNFTYDDTIFGIWVERRKIPS